MQQGADGVELDVMRCGSGEVVVVHDDTLERLAPGQAGAEQRVRETPLGELRRFDLGGGERIPTLDAVFRALGPQALVNVELKSASLRRPTDYLRLPLDDGLAMAVVKVLERAGRLSGSGLTLVSSFDPFQLLRFQSASRGMVPLGYLFEAGQSVRTRELYRLPLWSLAAVHPEAKLIDGPALRTWRQRGLRVNAWTVDNPSEIAAMAALGVEAIITNRPGAVRRQLTNR
jgi:glycerophosphoryl diester phosphodiesterase